MGLFGRSVRRWRHRLVAEVGAVAESLDAERRRAAGQRATGASTESLLDAVECAEDAWQRLSWGDDVGAALAVRRLADAARDWDDDAPLTASVRGLVPAADEILRRRPGDPRVAPPAVRSTPHPQDPRTEPEPAPTSEFLLPDALGLPTVVDLLSAGDEMGAVKEYRARTGVGLRDARAAVAYAARRVGHSWDS